MKPATNYPIKSKYFKQYFHFRNYGGVFKQNKRLRKAISARRAKLFEVKIKDMINSIPQHAVAYGLLEIYK